MDLGLRQTSKAFCGNRYLLEVGAAISEHQGESFTCMRIMEQTGILYQRVFEVLKRLENDGAIRRIRKTPAGVDYKAESNPFWEIAHDLVGHWDSI